MKRKVLSVLLTSAMVMSMAACGSSETTEAPASNDAAASTTTDSAAADTKTDAAASTDAAADTAADTETAFQLTEPIKAYVDGTVNYVKEDSGKEEFVSQLNAAISEKMGYDVTVEFTALDHSGYTDAVGRMFAGGDYPDVMIMNAGMFRQYATTGLLWNMADAYDNAEFQSRLTAPGLNEALKDKDGALYGFTPAIGGGCPTYVKKAWLDAVGMKAEDIKTYDDFYKMLEAFTTGDPDGNGVNGDTYGFISAGLYGQEAPHINYLPDFWQDGYPGLLKGEDGVWYDGMQTEATKKALLRMQEAYQAGVIDPVSYTAGTKEAREKFWSADQTGSAGVFCYWAGSWYDNIATNLEKNNVNTELVQLDPIAEVAAIGGYLNRESPVWVIIDDGDGDDAREQAIFDAFIEPMLDGDKCQTLWTYGAEGTHWSLKAEAITTGTGDKAKTTEYAEGEFHCLPTIADPTTLFKKNHIDNAAVIAPLTNGYSNTSDTVAASNTHFVNNCVDAPQAPSCDTITNEGVAITDAIKAVISSVVVEGGDVDAAMQTYVDTVGSIVDQALSELNAQ